jgi:hypothetical protein
MRRLQIKTTRMAGVFQAWLIDDPRKRSTATGSEYSAAHNLAVKVFLGPNRLAQNDAAELRKIIVSQTDHGTYLATYDKE